MQTFQLKARIFEENQTFCSKTAELRLAVYNETTGWWYYILSSSGALGYTKLGESGYVPVPADYDGDSKADLTVYQEASGYWFLIHSSAGSLTYQKLGEPGYKPVLR